jgi:hypothetical protein
MFSGIKRLNHNLVCKLVYNNKVHAQSGLEQGPHFWDHTSRPTPMPLRWRRLGRVALRIV